jgi:hypothetical protein
MAEELRVVALSRPYADIGGAGMRYHLGDSTSMTTLCGDAFADANVHQETWHQVVRTDHKGSVVICRTCQTHARAELVGLSPLAALRRQAERQAGIVHQLGMRPDSALKANLQAELSELGAVIKAQVAVALAGGHGWSEIGEALWMDEDAAWRLYGEGS